MSFAFQCMHCEIKMDKAFGTCDACAQMLDPTYIPPQYTIYVLKESEWTRVHKDNKSEIMKIASRMTDTYKVVNNFGDIIAIGESDEKG